MKSALDAAIQLRYNKAVLKEMFVSRIQITPADLMARPKFLRTAPIGFQPHDVEYHTLDQPSINGKTLALPAARL